MFKFDHFKTKQLTMSEIQIYNNSLQDLGEISFIKSTFDQVRVSEITNSLELTKRVIMISQEACIGLGIKNEISDFSKRDIKEMILMRFKHLSLDEVAYALKLERYGLLGDKTDHFQLFNADYVSRILEKYVVYKREVKRLHNISANVHAEPELSEEEKNKQINSGVINQLEHFLENDKIDTDRIYVYDVLVERLFLNPTNEEKVKIYEDAKMMLNLEYSKKKATSLRDSRSIKSTLAEILQPKSQKVINKSKELILAGYFRKLKRNQKDLEDFRKAFD